jgi:hypothetical protein
MLETAPALATKKAANSSLAAPRERIFWQCGARDTHFNKFASLPKSNLTVLSRSFHATIAP